MNIYYCKFCGKGLGTRTEKSGFFSKTVTNDCGCEEFLLNREIDKKIKNLNDSRPRQKYELTTTYKVEAIK